jgi:hypothetical protein
VIRIPLVIIFVAGLALSTTSMLALPDPAAPLRSLSTDQASFGGARQSAEGATAAERFWPQWRGPYANGVSKHADPPLEWSETKNVRWKVEIPGRGSASPIVWGDRIFVLSAVPIGVAGAAAHAPRGGLEPRDRHRFIVLAIDRRTGKTVWERVAREQQPHESNHQDNGPGRRAPRSPTASACTRGSSRKACTYTTWTASCSGRRTSATS